MRKRPPGERKTLKFFACPSVAPQQPEDDHSPQEHHLVGDWFVAPFEQLENITDARSEETIRDFQLTKWFSS
jgi:hypothetical protein